MRPAALLIASALFTLSAATGALAQPAEPAPLSDEMMVRYAALCEENKAAQAAKPGSMESLARGDLENLAKKHGFSGQEEVMAIGMRMAMVDMYVTDDPDSLAMIDSITDPDMKAMIARARADAPAVKGNAEALKACKAS